MKNRMELWKDYREEIEKNISLQQAAKNSDEKYMILEKRLLNILPNYKEKYKSLVSSFSVITIDTGVPVEYSLKDIDAFLEKLNIDDNNNLFGSIEKINFSSKELDDVIEEIENGKVKNLEYFDMKKNHDDKIVIKKIKLEEFSGKYRIAIDGPSGSGKSTIAKMIAEKYNLKYINTGLIYRAIALNVLKNGIDLNNESEVIDSYNENMIEFLSDETVILNGIDVSKKLRADEISQAASKVASIAKVREFATKLLKNYAKLEGVIMDGRDTTFNIMPNADLKIFLDTSAEVRARRRVEQNKILGFEDNYEKILSEIKERDERDRSREVDHLHKTDDAFLIDTSTKTINEVIKEIDNLILKLKLNEK